MSEDPPPTDPIDWSRCTFEGSEREQLRVWSQLPLRAKLEALDELSELALRMLESRRKAGLPYIDPDTGEVVRPERAVAEDPPKPPKKTSTAEQPPRDTPKPNA